MHSPEPSASAHIEQVTTGRHAKKLSLNFPSLPPLQSQQRVGLRTSSPTRSSTCSPRRMARHGVSTSPVTAVAHSIPSEKSGPAYYTTSGEDSETDDVLTLVAAQERRVLELREELHRAEAELQSLKRQWAVGETRKKSVEVGSKTHKMKRLSGGLPMAVPPTSQEDDYMRKERQLERRRSVVERGNTRSRHAPRKSQQRVFSSSRHTRALSLLAPSAPSQSQRLRRSSQEEIAYPSPSSDQCRSCAPLTDQATTKATVSEDVGFGRTYKNLANKKDIGRVPPAADVFMRQGQKVAEGLKEGLWSLFEDIRQATVGEEGINGVAPQQTMHPPQRASFGRNHSRTHIPQKGRHTEDREKSFWGEFGVDTPRKATVTSRAASTATQDTNRHSTTTSASVPDLLVDLHDNDEWEPWESPIVEHEDTGVRVNAIPSPKAGQPMPWPELKRPQSSNMKLTKSMSALMQDWEDDSSSNTEQATRNDRQGHEDDSHVLASQQI